MQAGVRRAARPGDAAAVSFEWIEGEAEEQDVKVSDAEVKKSFDQQKKQPFPKDEDYQKFLKDSGQTEEDILLRVRLELLSNKIREKITKGKDKVTDSRSRPTTTRTSSASPSPSARDLRIVLTKTKAKAEQAKKALEGGDSWEAVAKKYSIDQASKTQGGKLLGVAKGQQEKALDDAVFGAKKGKLTGPVKTPVRLLRLRGRQGQEGRPADAAGGHADDQAAPGLAEPAEGARQVRQGLPQSGRTRRSAATATRRRTARTRPKETPTPTPGAGGQQGPSSPGRARPGQQPQPDVQQPAAAAALGPRMRAPVS